MGYLKKLLLHKYYVLKAGLKLKVPVWRLIIHDWQKFMPAEFNAYKHYDFNGDNSDEAQYAFDLAWCHHENYGAHHWGWWIPRSGNHANKPLPMEEIYVREMIADWHGAGKTYQRSWDISEWFNKNCPQMIIHNDTIDLIHSIMNTELGYDPNHGHSGAFDFAPNVKLVM